MNSLYRFLTDNEQLLVQAAEMYLVYWWRFTGFEYVAEFFSQIEQTSFVVNDGIGSMEHESYLVFCIRIRSPYQNW